MSPILKRDVAEHVRQARRLAAAVTGTSLPERDSPSHDPFSKIADSELDPSLGRHEHAPDIPIPSPENARAPDIERTEGAGVTVTERYASGVRHAGMDEQVGRTVLEEWKQTRPDRKGKGRANGHDQDEEVDSGASLNSHGRENGLGMGYEHESSHSLQNGYSHGYDQPHGRTLSTHSSTGPMQHRASARSSDAGEGAGAGEPHRARLGGDEDTDDEEQRWGLGNGEVEMELLVPHPHTRRQSRPRRTDGNGGSSRAGQGRQEREGQVRSPADSDDAASDLTTMSAIEGKWSDLRSLLLESTPSLLLSLVGLVFTGELLEHLARWRVFRRVDELFILVPMLGNLKGNLEMCLSARLGTSANIGELDDRRTRRLLLTSNMTLLCLQALLISCLAAFISFVLGLITTHRLGDAPPPSVPVTTNSTYDGPLDPGLAVGEQEWHEGYTRPGFKQLVMVLATGMAAAGGSSVVIGSFMSSAIVLCRWLHIDPDNITPPVAACLGDLVTLFILALIGTVLVGTMDSPIPILAVIIMSFAAVWFTRRVMRDEWVKNVARGGWIPLIGAMLISSGTGMVLEKGVGKYRGFALLAISMTGLTGSLGAIHANRLSTSLHTGLHPSSAARHHGITPGQEVLTLFLLAFPCQAAFLLFVNWAGWIDISLAWAGWVAFALTSAFSIILAHYMTMLFWAKDLDPDSYTLPIHSAIVDFVGQLVLMSAYEVCIWSGNTTVTDVV